MRRFILLLASVVGCANPSSSPIDDPGEGGKADEWGPRNPGAINSGKISWTCNDTNGSLVVSLVHQGTKIISEQIRNYHVVENGVKREDAAIGDTVGDVNIGALRFLDSVELQFSTSLMDYSDSMRWTFLLQSNYDAIGHTGEHYFGFLSSTFQSGDHDQLLHPSSQSLVCTITRS